MRAARLHEYTDDMSAGLQLDESGAPEGLFDACTQPSSRVQTDAPSISYRLAGPHAVSNMSDSASPLDLYGHVPNRFDLT